MVTSRLWVEGIALKKKGYVIGAMLVFYVAVALPNWFYRPNPVIFVPVTFAAIALYLLYIDLITGGGWFLSFAFPVTGAVCLLVTAVVTLTRYIRKGRLYIFGGAVIALGAFMPLLEHLLQRCLDLRLKAGSHHGDIPVLGVAGHRKGGGGQQ